MLDLLGGTVMYRELIAVHSVDDEFVGRLVDRILTAFGAAGA